MIKKSVTTKAPAEQVVQDIRRATRNAAMQANRTAWDYEVKQDTLKYVRA